MANILIASLGKSPIVVTAMVRALQEEKRNFKIDKVILLYPEEHTLIKDGVALIEKYCLCRNVDTNWGLPFSDADSEEHCFHFLQTLNTVLEIHSKDDVWLSLAGGRKSMSALISLLAPFYENIKGLYHILDKNEGAQDENFHYLDDLIDAFLEDSELREIMNPSPDKLKLIKIPFEHFADTLNIRKILGSNIAGQPLDSAAISLNRIHPDTYDFWETVFKHQNIPKFNKIRFSENSKKQFESSQINRLNFSRYFSLTKLRNTDWADRRGKNGGKHAVFNSSHADDATRFFVAKISRMAERIVWYRGRNDCAVIAELGVEQNNGQYRRVGANTNLDNDYFSKKTAKGYSPQYRLHDLIPSGNATLLAALGKSPMIVTQAYIFLQLFENIKIEQVAVIFPNNNYGIENGVQLLEDVFATKNVKVIKYEADLGDVDSKAACEVFLQCMVNAIDDLNTKNPDSSIQMLLSGGRKGMSALSLLAAQRSGITDVYHTLVMNPELEKSLEKDGRLEQLQSLKSNREKTKKMFLEDYMANPDNDFVLFKIPVIPFTFA